MEINEGFVRQAIELARRARERGNRPFGALVVVDKQVVLTAENTVNSEANPTCHAETNLVQKAIRDLSGEQRSRATLYTSCEPCPMCAGAIYWAGIRSVVYALPVEKLRNLSGRGFSTSCRELFASAGEKVEVGGPVLMEEALKVHQGYWTSQPLSGAK